MTTWTCDIIKAHQHVFLFYLSLWRFKSLQGIQPNKVKGRIIVIAEIMWQTHFEDLFGEEKKKLKKSTYQQNVFNGRLYVWFPFPTQIHRGTWARLPSRLCLLSDAWVRWFGFATIVLQGSDMQHQPQHAAPSGIYSAKLQV